MDETLIRAVALALTPGIGWKTIHRLLAQFETLDTILRASQVELQTVPSIGPKIAAAIRAVDLSRIEMDLRRFNEQGIGVMTWLDEDFPAALRTVDDAPLVLFYRGVLMPSDARAVAIVGTREPSDDSIGKAETLAAEFAGQGWAVISGLARGIDTAAHRGALAAGGQSLAVLGCGVNRIYPPENGELARQLAANGAILSECHPDTKPSPLALTIRNRIITGLSRAVIIIEAGPTSGALHAARKAHAQGRPVFAIDNGSEGNRTLLADYARATENAAQIMSALD